MIFGIGCDLCQVARMEKSLSGPHAVTFALRVFGPAERAALGFDGGVAENSACAPIPGGPCDSGPGKAVPAKAPAHRFESAAADFAAKEAFLKAAGTGFAGGFNLCEIEAVRLPSGAPAYRFAGTAAAWMEQNRLTAQLSLSHDGGVALAFCVLEMREGCGA